MARKMITLGTVLYNERNGLYYFVDSIEPLGGTYVYNCICGTEYDEESENVLEVESKRWIREEKAQSMQRMN